jgi:competence protein ComEC
MKKFTIYAWKKIPIFRLLVPFCLGILVQFYWQAPIQVPVYCLLFVSSMYVLFLVLSSIQNFIWAWVKGLFIQLGFLCMGMLIGAIEYNKNSSADFTKNKGSTFYICTITEPPIEKQNSFKAVATIYTIDTVNISATTSKKILLYFKKADSTPLLTYGQQIIIYKNIQPIVNAGNPGGFDYKRYCLFQGIIGQTFLNKKDYSILQTTQTSFLQKIILQLRNTTLSILQNNINHNQTVSVAEALLIGYRDDLDRDIVQAYSNTGIVHIIAISGMHLGMIYLLMVALLKPLAKFKWIKFMKPIVILLILWTFTLLAGAAPSIVRSAVMFSFIAIGESMGKQSSIYNNLSLSAFIIVLFAPFSLWDVGFQLSYAAVLSIVLFSKPIESWLFFQNKLLKTIWSITAVTIAAQILTLPLVLYHFHQFPNLFLFTNLVAVPLSTFILYAELLLLVFAWCTPVASFIGSLIDQQISCLNQFVLFMNENPLAVWSGIQLSGIQTLFLFGVLIGFSFWLLHKNKALFWMGCICSIGFLSIRCIDFVEKEKQQKLIVYNIPKHQAIDIIEGRKAKFIGDKILLEDGFLRNFHLQPSRIKNRILLTDSIQSIIVNNHYIISKNKTIILLNQSNAQQLQTLPKLKATAVVISGNPKLYMDQLVQHIDCPLIVADASNPQWKIDRWKKDANNLHLRLISLVEQGAFEMDL